MAHRICGYRRRHLRRAVAGSVILAAMVFPARVRGQGAQVDLGAPPGAAAGSNTLGAPLGAANFPDFGTPSSAPISGRAGTRGSHVPVASQAQPSAPALRTPTRVPSGIQTVQPQDVPTYGNLDLPAGQLEYGPENGMTLDAAIDLLVKQNLDLYALRLEIPMAEADVLTAGLRANPIFYADTQLIPYGHFSFLRPGGPPQSDVNINYPLDVTRKRRARTASAVRAKQVSEAQLQDVIRIQIDNLYTVYVDVIAAGLTVRFSEKYVEGLTQLLRLNQDLFGKGLLQESDLLAIQANMEKARLQVRESVQAKAKANQALALLLNLPLADVEGFDVRDSVGLLDPLPLPKDVLVSKALAARPDLAAVKLGVLRAQSDVKLARANAYPDVYVLYQPYTFQNNTYLGVPSAYSWTLGVTATIPAFNRNQGNVTRAKINVTQTAVQARSQERSVISDVLNAVREHEQSLASVLQLKNVILPTSAKVRDAAYRRWQGGETSALEYLDAQQAYNEVVRQYRDLLVRSRRADLDLNTAVGERVLP